MFAEQMGYLHHRGVHPITVGHLAEIISGQDRLPDRPVVLTFDDGYADFYTHALPVLTRYGFAATVYIATAFVGGRSSWLRYENETGRPMLTWAQVKELTATGVECGGHSHTHPQLDTLPADSAAGEIRRCKSILEQQLGRAICSFAYPFGYYSLTTRRLVQDAGFTSACGVTSARSSTADDPFALARIMVSNGTELPEFAALLEGRGLPVAPRPLPARTRLRWAARRGAMRLERSVRLEARLRNVLGVSSRAGKGR